MRAEDIVRHRVSRFTPCRTSSPIASHSLQVGPVESDARPYYGWHGKGLTLRSATPAALTPPRRQRAPSVPSAAGWCIVLATLAIPTMCSDLLRRRVRLAPSTTLFI